MSDFIPRSEEIQKVMVLLFIARKADLENEVVLDALIHMKENSKLLPSEALKMGLNDWIK
jgi:hypothetical protein